jgi:hypothetical protein
MLMEVFNPLNTELNPICHLLALLGAHHILHVSRIRVNNLDYKTTCFGAEPSSDFLLKYLGSKTIHIRRVCLRRWRDLYIFIVGKAG